MYEEAICSNTKSPFSSNLLSRPFHVGYFSHYLRLSILNVLAAATDIAHSLRVSPSKLRVEAGQGTRAVDSREPRESGALRVTLHSLYQ